MKHFVAYHKVDAYGSYGISRGKIFRHFSQKSPTFLQRAVGETVQVFSGETVHGKKVYKLCSAYIARRIIPDGNAYLVEGTGIGFNPHIEVNDFAWFWELFNEAHHFRDGFSEIRSQQVIKNLEKLAQSPDKIFFSEAEITAEDAPNDLRLPLKRTLTVQRVIRDSVIGKAQKQRYQYECQVCGTTIELPNGKRYAEAHHLRPVGKPHNGKDGFPNTIVVCPQHHAMFDLGAIAIEPESYLVKYWNKDEGKKNSRLILNHDLDPACVQYHHRKIFRGGGK